MDYRYIENLIERYFACETSVEEERILMAFFHQEEVPEALKPYAVLFEVQGEFRGAALDDDFDARLEARLEAEGAAPTRRVKLQRLTFADRIRPLMRAAAIVAVVALFGHSIQSAYYTATYAPFDAENVEVIEADMNRQHPGPIPEKYIQDKERMALEVDSLAFPFPME